MRTKMPISRKSSRRRSPGRGPLGQALVEFAFTLPIFLLIVFGSVDLGRWVYGHSTLSQAAREGARLAAVEVSWVGSTDPSCNTDGGPVCPADLAALRQDVLNATNRMLVPFGPLTLAELYTSCDAAGTQPSGAWTTQTCDVNNRGFGDNVSVRVTMQFNMITPILAQLFPPITESAAATMVIN